MKSICIGRVELDGRHVSGLRYTLQDARVAARLQAAGVPARLYTGKAEGRVLDLVRQLVRVRADAFLFTVSRLSLAPTLQLVEGLQQLRPGQCVLFAIDDAGDVAADADLRAALAARGEVLPATATDALVGALTAGFEATPASAPRHASPYVSGLLSFDDARRLGFALDQDASSLCDELAWLARQPGHADATVRLDAGTASPERLAAACAAIADAAPACRFELHATARAFSPDLLDALLAAGVDRIVLAGAAGPVDLHGRAIALAVAGEAEAAALAARYGTNGVIALHTGCYFDANQAPAIYHVEVPLGLPQDARRRAYEWSAPNMALRSAAVVTGPLDLMLDHLPALRPAGSETGGWPKHTYAIAASDGAGEVIFDGVRMPAQEIRYVPLHRLAGAERAPHARTFATLHAAEDVAALEQCLATFHATGRLQVPHPDYPLYFENMCRWLGNGACRLPLLRRIAVDGDGGVRACRDAGTLGVVGDSYDQLLLVAKQKQQMEDVRRGCATCPVRDDCSRCSQLPAEWGGRYCGIRQAHRMTPFYFELFAFPHLAGQLLPDAQADVELAVSWTGLPPQHYHGPAGEAPAGARPALVTLGEQHLAWWRGTRRLTRLSAPMALMAEAWWAGAANDDIERALAERFGADAATARTSLVAGLDKLRAGGVIHG